MQPATKVPTYHIAKAGIRIAGLDVSAIRLAVKEEAGHVALGLVGILVLLAGSLLHFDDDFLLDFAVILVRIGITHFRRKLASKLDR